MSGQIGAIDELAVILVLLARDHVKGFHYVQSDPGSTRMTLPDGSQVKLGDWMEDKVYDSLSLTKDQTHDLIEGTIRIACGDGYDPEDLVHPEGVEALALYMYCLATDTWERDIPHLPEVNGRALNVPGARQAWRWRRILTKAVSIISARKHQP